MEEAHIGQFNLPVLIAFAGLKSDGCDGGAGRIAGHLSVGEVQRDDGRPLVRLDFDHHYRPIMKIVSISVKVSDAAKRVESMGVKPW